MRYQFLEIMIKVHPQYIKDANGVKSLVILPAKEFNSIMEELEDLEDITLYEEATLKDSGERISLSEYVKNRKVKNG